MKRSMLVLSVILLLSALFGTASAEAANAGTLYTRINSNITIPLSQGETVHVDYLDLTSDPAAGTGVTLADFTVSYGTAATDNLIVGEDGSIRLADNAPLSSYGLLAYYDPISTKKGKPFSVYYSVKGYAALTEFTVSTDSIRMGVGETISFTANQTTNSYTNLQVSGADPDGLTETHAFTAFTTANACWKLSVTAIAPGSYTLLLDAGYGFTQTVNVTVEPAAAGLTLSSDHIVVPCGETISLGADLGGGYSSQLTQSAYDTSTNAAVADFRDSGYSVYGKKVGYNTYQAKTQNGYTFKYGVLVTDAEANHIQLQPESLTGGLGKKSDIALTVKDESGRTVICDVRILDGEEYGQLIFLTDGTCTLRGLALGTVRVCAYGTDGSTDTAEIEILPMADTVGISQSEATLTVGESLQLNAIYPEGTWAKVTWTYTDYSQGNDQSPISLNKGLVTAYAPGSVIVSLFQPDTQRSAQCAITVLDSDARLHMTGVDTPVAIGHPAQIGLSDQTGAPYTGAVTYSLMSNYSSITADGVLTSTWPETVTVTVALADGHTLTRSVSTVYAPETLSYPDGSITLPINGTAKLGTVSCDVTDSLKSKWFSVKAEDPEILQYEDGVLYPLQEDTTALIVTPVYGTAVPLRIPVTVTAADDTLYLTSESQYDSLVAQGETVTLPGLVNWYGEAQACTYTKETEYQANGKSSPFSLNASAGTLRCSYGTSYCTIRITAADGRSTVVTYIGYNKTKKISFENASVSGTVGTSCSVTLLAAEGTNYANFSPKDVTLTVTSQNTGATATIPLDDMIYSYENGSIGVRWVPTEPDVLTFNASTGSGLTASCTVTIKANAQCAAYGHNVVVDAAVAPTLTAAGLTEGSHCSRCGQVLTVQEALPATGHPTLTPDTVTLSLSEGINQCLLKAGLEEGDPGDAQVLWYSLNPSIVKVHGGRLTAVSEGKALVLAFIGDCTPVSCLVTVSASVNTLTLKPGITVIEEEAFIETAFALIVIPSTVTTIEARAFADNAHLLCVDIPASVTGISDDAFAGCQQLTVFCPEGSTAQRWAESHGFDVILK